MVTDIVKSPLAAASSPKLGNSTASQPAKFRRSIPDFGSSTQESDESFEEEKFSGEDKTEKTLTESRPDSSKESEEEDDPLSTSTDKTVPMEEAASQASSVDEAELEKFLNSCELETPEKDPGEVQSDNQEFSTAQKDFDDAKSPALGKSAAETPETDTPGDEGSSDASASQQSLEIAEEEHTVKLASSFLDNEAEEYNGHSSEDGSEKEDEDQRKGKKSDKARDTDDER